jgi:TonB family protein
MDMSSTPRIISLFLLTVTLSLASISDSTESCKSDGPLLTNEDGKPIWLNTDALVKSAVHCVAPQWPALARQAEIEAQVLVDILVNQEGRVICVHLINGPPLLASSATDAARNWVFKPKKLKEKPVSFYGHLSFFYSTRGAPVEQNPCTAAHW